MAYEVVTFSLRDEITEASTPPVLNEYILDQLVIESGVQMGYWGREKEDPNKVYISAIWDSVEAHRELQGKECGDLYYLPWVQRLNDITDVSNIQAFHTHLMPHPADQVLHNEASPVTEIFLAYFPTDYSAATQQDFVEKITTFVDTVSSEAKGLTGFSGGWSMEDCPIPGRTDSGKTYLACLGWESVEAHQMFVESEAFKDNQHLVSQADRLIYTKVVHYSGIRFK